MNRSALKSPTVGLTCPDFPVFGSLTATIEVVGNTGKLSSEKGSLKILSRGRLDFAVLPEFLLLNDQAIVAYGFLCQVLSKFSLGTDQVGEALNFGLVWINCSEGAISLGQHLKSKGVRVFGRSAQVGSRKNSQADSSRRHS